MCDHQDLAAALATDDNLSAADKGCMLYVPTFFNCEIMKHAKLICCQLRSILRKNPTNIC
jgi:hypothetical protein